MGKNKLKLFVGGYYDARIFKGSHFDGKTPFGDSIDTYTLEEALKLSFVEGTKEWFEQEGEEWYEEEFGKEYIENEYFGVDFDSLTDEEKTQAILKYTSSDEIAGLEYFDTEEEAEKYRNEVLEEIEDSERNSIYCKQIRDNYCGCFRDVYVHKNDIEEYESERRWRISSIKSGM